MSLSCDKEAHGPTMILALRFKFLEASISSMAIIVSCMGANFVAREVGYSLPGDWTVSDWGNGDRAANEYFRPLESYRERLAALLQEIVQMGFTAIDLWTAHL